MSEASTGKLAATMFRTGHRARGDARHIGNHHVIIVSAGMETGRGDREI